jgi:hypothetical protein
MNFNTMTQGLVPTSATLTPLGGAAAAVAGRHNGLPVVGFMVHNYQNAGVTSRYGGVVEHKFTRNIL